MRYRGPFLLPEEKKRETSSHPPGGSPGIILVKLSQEKAPISLRNVSQGSVGGSFYPGSLFHVYLTPPFPVYKNIYTYIPGKASDRLMESVTLKDQQGEGGEGGLKFVSTVWAPLGAKNACYLPGGQQLV